MILRNQAMGLYFRTDINRLSFRELWRMSSRPSGFFRGCINKIFGIPWPVRTAVLHEERIAVVPADEIPAAAWRDLEPMVADLEELGARLAFYQTVPALGNLQGYAAVLLPRERNAVIMANWVARAADRAGKGNHRLRGDLGAGGRDVLHHDEPSPAFRHAAGIQSPGAGGTPRQANCLTAIRMLSRSPPRRPCRSRTRSGQRKCW